MNKSRLEAFSDGVIAIIITIMVLYFKVPEGADIENLKPLVPLFFCYVLSFVYVGIYWNNHHHMFQVVKTINGSIMWANLFLLFWLSMIPFVTEWVGKQNFDTWPVVCYGVVLILNAIAYTILSKLLIRHHGKDSLIAQALGDDSKGKLSIALYAAGLGVSFFNAFIGFSFYIIVALIWLIPDKRIENKVIVK